jgi:glycosyltransferase involved in cell wall biosynthesis
MPEPQPRVVLGADPLFQPFTGIGNYTRNLASNLLALKLLQELTLYANGAVLRGDTLASLIDAPAVLSSGEDGTRSGAKWVGGLVRARAYLASKEWAVKAYQSLMPMVDRARLYPYRGAVFHSPNYLLPPFSGPTVATFHDLSIQRYPEFHPAARIQLLDRRMGEVAKSASHIITDSIGVREEVIEYFGIDASRVTAIPLAAGEQFQPRTEDACRAVLQRLGLAYKHFYLFTSTIEPRKNLLRICEAYAALREAGKTDWPIIFAGGAGWQSEAEHQAIQALVNRGWAQYLGFADATTLPVLYSAAGALVFPSVYEGFGLPALEAQQSGTRVITSRGSAMAEFSSEHDLLVDPLEVDSLIEAMETVVERVLADNGRPLHCAGSGLSWQKTARLTAEVYKKVLAARH